MTLVPMSPRSTFPEDSHLHLVVLEKAVSVQEVGDGESLPWICRPVASAALLTAVGATTMLLKCIYPLRPLVFKDFLLRCSITPYNRILDKNAVFFKEVTTGQLAAKPSTFSLYHSFSVPFILFAHFSEVLDHKNSLTCGCRSEVTQ